VSSRNLSLYAEPPRKNAPSLRVRVSVVGLAAIVILLLAVVGGLVAYQYARKASRSRTAQAAPVSTAATPKPEVSDTPAVRKVDPQFLDGNMQVTIGLDQPVAYDAHRLDHPDRVYVDLHDVRLAPELAGKTVFVNDGGLSDVRLAPTQANTVRVVLDLQRRFDYTVAQQTNPAALVLKLTPRAQLSQRQAAIRQHKKTVQP